MRVNSAAGPTRTGRAWGGAAVCGGVNTRPCTMLVTTAGAEGAVGGWGGVEPVVAAVRRCARHVGSMVAARSAPRRGGRAAKSLKSQSRPRPAHALSRISCAAQFHTQRDQALCFICCPHTNPTQCCASRMHKETTRSGHSHEKAKQPKNATQTQTYFIGRP